jgi:ATP-dependent Clp protease ATP-binding subunit ClpC
MVVGPDDIAAIVSLWSGIQVLQLTADERILLVGLDEKLRRQVIGQPLFLELLRDSKLA